MLATDKKSLTVPVEGIWVVDDYGRIALQADKNLTGPPTAIRYQFADIKGNLSNEAVVMIDPALIQVYSVPSSFDDIYDDTLADPYATFWANFNGQTTPADGDDFIAATTLLASMLQGSVAPGPEPVDSDAFETAFETWDKAGQPPDWSDPASPFALCEQLVEQALQNDTTKWRKVYWRLTLMARLAAKALPHSGN